MCLTKKQAVKKFKENILPNLNKNDKLAVREAFGIYTDSLCKDGYITLKKYETWDNPF